MRSLDSEKAEQKLYRYHTGYFGGLREQKLSWMLENKPEEVVRQAVKRMLPKGKLGRQMFKKLKVSAGPEHPHAAQKPEPIQFSTGREARVG